MQDVRVDFVRLALYTKPLPLLDDSAVRQLLERLGSDQNSAGRSEVLEPRGGVDGVADDG